jgi:aminoglycoside N3'-acetyltransferase
MMARPQLRNYIPHPFMHWLRRKRNGLRAQQREQNSKRLLAKYGTFTSAQLIATCREAGVAPNGVLFVQCSYNDLPTYADSPFDLLNALHELAGPEGTLLMPAYSTNMNDVPCRPFDVRREPATTGIVAELFRREPGVLRSLHPRHSLCAVGPRAKELLADHDKCVYADGPNSPFDRIRQLNAQSLCLGMAPGFTSFIHWVEDIEPEKYPARAHDGPYECRLKDSQGQESVASFYRRRPGQRKKEKLIGQSLSPASLHAVPFFGTSLCVYSWPALATELISLRDQGITYYV